ncbi:longitudinals lacking protein, isoforms F/I/K/T-like [Thrips palmi]|uniref:Longitudinals lacking protein, isoforms F/I/K/T-like n=1 Tax=Thrips palmi TaxID=161013 RepID=A0A6P8ZBJ8_THRPL|nr:longitudinals lacking protein, isoforms F/I/K/T-like [Thrips palmi]
MGGTRFMVQWEEHPSHLATRLGQLLEHQTLVDVTLMCNTHTLRVHRAVLAACSPYFESILQRQLGAHPLIVLKDMQFSVLKSLIEFMYCGETSVTEDNLGALLQAAKFFQVKGLSSMTKEALGLPSSPSKPVPTPTPVPINGDFAKKVPQLRTPTSGKKIGMQTTLVSTAEVMNKQIVASNSTATTTTAGTAGTASVHGRVGPGGDSPAVKVASAQGTSTISTDTAQLLLNLSGVEGTSQAVTTIETPVQAAASKLATTTSTQSRPMLQMSSRNVRLTNIRGSNMMKIDAKTLVEKSKLGETPAVGAHHIDESPRRRGRPLKKQINVMFQEKVMSDAEVALQKEADASRMALEALKREMNTGDPGNAAAVEAELVEAGARSQEIQDEDMMVKHEEDISHGSQTLIASEENSQESEANPGEVLYQVTADGQVVATGGSDPNAAGNVASYMEALKEAGLPTDLPILLDSGDGSYVTVNEEVLMNICNGGVIHYQVAEGNLVQGTDGQVVVEEGENEAEQEFLQTEPQEELKQVTTASQSVIQESKPGSKPKVATPASSCGYTTARQIVKASMEKFRQEQAGIRKFVVKEMQEAELVMEPGDENPELVSDEVHMEQGEQADDAIMHDEHGMVNDEQQHLVSTTTVEPTLVQSGGQVQALLQTFGEDGESQQEMVYLVTENADEVIASGNFGDGTHSFAVVSDGSTVDGTHTFSIADGNIVVQQGQEEAEMSVEQALEAMMGGSDASNHDTPQSAQQAAVDAESMRLVLGAEDHDDKSSNSVLLGESNKNEDTLAILTDNTKLEDTLLDDLNDDDDETSSKDIPLAVGLLPLRTALERIQATPEHQPRKTRASSLTGEGSKGGKRRSDSGSETVEKKARSDEVVDSDGIGDDRFDAEEENSSSYDVETSLGVITEDGLKDAP